MTATRTRAALRGPASLRGRVTVAVLLLLAVLLTSLFVVVNVALGSRLRSDLRTRLTDRAALARQLDASLSSRQLVQQLRGEGVTAQLCSAGQGCIVADPTPVPPGAPGSNRSASPPGPPGAPRPGHKPQAVRPPGVQRAGGTLFVRTTLADGQQLTLSVDDTAVGSTLSRLIALEVAGGLVALAVCGLLLGRVVGVALKPLDRMTGLASDIAGGDRGRRLGTGRADTELGRTAGAFDAMLDELETALASARDAENTMRTFLSDASHELRSPLAGLRATVENLLRADPDRPERERALATAVRESARAARLVDDLLTVSRGEEGLALHREEVDLAELVATEVDRYRMLAPTITWRARGEESVLVIADPLRLGQVLTNLFDNARHATPDGGTVTVTTSRSSQVAAVGVVDTGPGVSGSDAERIFDRLVRLDISRARESGGAGLGLPIARAIARAHGGEVSVMPRCEAQAGGNFRLTLPATAPPSREDACAVRGQELLAASNASCTGAGIRPRSDTA